MSAWPVVTLDDVAEWGSGGTPPRGDATNFGDGVPWLSVAELNDGLVDGARESLTEAGLARSSAKRLPAGVLLIAMYASVGKLGIATREVCTSQAIAHALPDETMVNRGFLFHYLRAERPLFQLRGRGVTQKNIGLGDLRSWPIPLPSLDEQRRIAAILDQADALRVARRYVLERLDDLMASLFDSEVDRRNRAVELGDVISSFRYGTSNKSGPNGYPTLRIPNVIGGAIDTTSLKTVAVTPAEVERLRLEEGDILFVRTNGNQNNVGRSAVFHGEDKGDESWLYASYLIRARPLPGVEPDYLAGFLAGPRSRSALARASSTSAGQYNINIQSLSSVPIVLPPRERQRELVDRARQVRAEVKVHSEELAQLDALFASLQARAFRGEL